MSASVLAPAVERSVAHAGARARIRVMFCIDNMQIGGTELNAVRTAELLDRARFELSVVCLQRDGPLAARYAAAGIPVISFALKNLYGLDAIRQGLRLAAFIKQHDVDIFHAHDFYSNIFGVVWARVSRTPVVIASRRWWAWPPRRAQRVLNRWASRFADRVLANSRTIAEMLHTTERFPRTHVVVIPNFVDDRSTAALAPEQRVALLRELGVPATARVIGVVASLSPVKDHATLFRAVAQLTQWPELHVVLVGDGPCRPALEDLAGQLGIGQRVHFAGMRHDGPRLHQLFDVSVLCSLSEGFPNTLLEAMAQAVPVVATDVGGNCDAVSDGVTGFLVPPSQPARIAAALHVLLDDAPRRHTMGVAAQRYVREHFGATRVIASLEALYSSLVSAS